MREKEGEGGGRGGGEGRAGRGTRKCGRREGKTEKVQKGRGREEE